MMRGGLLLIALAGCAGDPCSGDSGSCLVLEVTSHLQLDALGVTLSGAVQFDKQAPLSSLPVLVALHLPSTSGALHIEGTGYLRGAAAASGVLDVQLTPREHLRRTLALTSASAGDMAHPDLASVDLQPDLESPDLESPDLGPSPDLSPLPDLLIAQVASCADGLANQGESDIDCGGPCAAKCTAGQKCGGNGDCGTGSCLANRCVLALCTSDGAAFADKVDYAAITGTSGFQLGDLDGDGDVDIVAENYNGGAFSVLLNNGDGTFAAHVDYPTGANTSPAVSIGDLDGDQIPDVAATIGGTADILPFKGVGDGTFVSPSDSLQVANNEGPPAIVDVNGDGVNDLVVANGQQSVNTAPNKLYVRLGLGGGLFATRVGYSVSGNSGQMRVADVNADGKPDILVNNLYTNDVGVLLNAGSGTFAAVTNYPVGTEPQNLEAVDVSGDGKPDIVTTNIASDNLSVLVNQGGGAFAAHQELTNGSPGTWTSGLAVTDLNGDGLADIAFTSINANKLRVLANQGGGGTTFTTVKDYTTATQPYALRAADLDGDGQADLVTGDNNGFVSVFLHSGQGPFASPSPIPAGAASSYVAAGDLDGDGKPDLVAATGFVTVMLNQGATFGAPTNFVAGPSPAAIALVDLDGDGKLDVAASSGDGTLSVLLNEGGGVLHAARSFTSGTSASAVIAGDFNGDGWPDLAVANPSDGSVSLFINLGRWPSGGGLAAAKHYTLSGAPSSLAAADFDGDGHLDLAVASTSGTLQLVRNQGDGTFAAPVPYAAGSALAGVTAGDFDGDGKPDLALINGAGIGVLFNKGDGSFLQRIDFPLSEAPLRVLTADFDGDGHLDVGAVGASRVSVLRSLGRRQLAPMARYSMASGTTGLAAADFSGDGRVDLITSNGSDNQLRLRRGRCW